MQLLSVVLCVIGASHFPFLAEARVQTMGAHCIVVDLSLRLGNLAYILVYYLQTLRTSKLFQAFIQFTQCFPDRCCSAWFSYDSQLVEFEKNRFTSRNSLAIVRCIAETGHLYSTTMPILQGKHEYIFFGFGSLICDL